MTTYAPNAPANSLTENTKLTHAVEPNVTVGGAVVPATGQQFPLKG
jgi:hypothetical protein